MKLLTEPLLSPSRANMFHEDKKGFIDHYVFGIEKDPTPAMVKGGSIGKLVELIFNQKVKKIEEIKWTDKYITPDNENWLGSRSKKRDPNKVYIEFEFLNILKELLFFINKTSPFKDIKTYLYDENLESEVTFTNEALGLTGKADFFLKEKGIVIENKTGGDGAFNFSKFRYALQQIMYSMCIDNFHRFYFLFIKSSIPYQVKLMTFEEDYLTFVTDRLKNEIIPEYQRLISVIKSISQDLSFYDKPEAKEVVFNRMIKEGFLNCVETVETKQWDYK